MELYIKNIGKIKEASIDIDGITAIAGKNNTGKSTVGKSLFAMFNSMYMLDSKILSERKLAVNNNIFTFEFGLYNNDIESIHSVGGIGKNKIFSDISSIDNLDEDKIKDVLNRYYGNFNYNAENFERLANEIYNVLKINDDEFKSIIVNRNFNGEFKNQIRNIFNGVRSEVSLKIKDRELKAIFNDNKIEELVSMNLVKRISYIDDPFIFDKMDYNSLNRVYNHKKVLESQLSETVDISVYEELIAKERFKNILDKINDIVPGDLNRNVSGMEYRFKNSDKSISVSNLSSGIKTFVILKKLILNGIISDNSSIVLDEPEVHLHPEWQLIFAEILVLMQKEFNLHVLIATHSPYFLNAIEVYSKKHGIENSCNYYLAENEEQSSVFRNVNKNLEAIYQQLARPIQVLENERYYEA